ncbi:phosphotransferase [Roseibium sp.]|uniref:phosphotransferase n=1 Tax=Roseibium sp. TaxID=1936156 RepID=UPI003A970204
MDPAVFCEAVLERFGTARQITGSLSSASRLPGLTNRVFLLVAENGRFVLRVPRVEMAGRIDREAEWHDLQMAADLGVTVRPLFGDPQSGVLLLPEVESNGALTAEALGRCLAVLHGSPQGFRAHRDPLRYLGECEADAGQVEPLPKELRSLCAGLRDLLVSVPDDGLVSCHFDLSPGNLLPQADHLLLIDFEYAAMAHRAWDLAYAVLENDFDAAQEVALLTAYEAAGGVVPDSRTTCIYKLNCDVISALWAFGQVRQGNAVADFRGFASKRIQRALASGLI